MRKRDFWEVLVLSIVLALIVKFTLVSVYKIPTSSMAPTLWPGDFILVSKVKYGLKLPFIANKIELNLPQRGDVVSFEYPGKLGTTFIKRIIGLPGDHIDIRGQDIFINDIKIKLTEVNSDSIKGSWAKYPGNEYLKIYNELLDNKTHFIVHTNENKKADSTLGPFVVPPNEYFVLGDNRESSDDSRYWGTIPFSLIEGKVIYIWLSLDHNNRWAGNKLPSIRKARTFIQLD